MKDKLFYILRNPFRLFVYLITKWNPYFRFLYRTSDYQSRINFNMWFIQKILNVGGNRKAYWPVHWTSTVYDADKILVGVDAYPGVMGNCYIQGRGGIEIGNYTQIAGGVAIISSNHDVYDSRKHIDSPVKIGKYCWLGAGAKIMPGVELGDWTIVAAGAVVTKSFPQGYCVLGGVPAAVIKTLDKEKCIPYKHQFAFHGFIAGEKFDAFRKKKLKI